jgi:NAD(P)-dependent dehydrogenase (short-subunit alcohol dehydrogenase family)
LGLGVIFYLSLIGEKEEFMADQTTKQDPVEQYQKPPFEKQTQPEPGLAKDMNPKPDHGEQSYKGSGRLKARKALVTGADSGIGRAAAIAFAREGADIVMNYLPSEEPDATQVAKLIEEAGQKVVKMPGDLSDENFCKELVERTVSELGGIDILANIAGKQIAQKEIADISTEQYEQTVKVNIFGMFWLCKFAVPHMKPGAAIINTTSIQAYQPSPTLLDYATTKAAIANFTHGFAQQVAEKGIRVNAIAPGPIWTPLQPSKGQTAEKIPQFGGQSAYGRPGQPAEVAPAYVFLASQESSFITGEVIGVTGGGQHLP